MVYKFDELFKWQSGKPIKEQEGNIPIYGSNGIIGYTDKYKFKNKIILGRVGAYCGSVEYCESEFNATDNTLITECNEDLITYRYAYYLLKLYDLNKYAGGAAQPLITQSILKHLKCNIPSIEIQNNISNLLFEYDNLIKNNNNRISILEQMAEEIYKEWFVRIYKRKNVTCQKYITLEELGIIMESGSRPKGGIDLELKDGVPSLGAESINGIGEYDYNSTKFIPKDFYDRMKNGKSSNDDILIYKDGAYIGKITLFRNNFPFEKYAVNEHVFLVRSKNKIFQNYLYFTLHQEQYFNLMQNLNRNAAQPGLSRGDINRIKIVEPILELINKFNEIVNPIIDEIFKLSKINQNLIEQRDLLLPRLMSGKLEVK